MVFLFVLFYFSVARSPPFFLGLCAVWSRDLTLLSFPPPESTRLAPLYFGLFPRLLKRAYPLGRCGALPAAKSVLLSPTLLTGAGLRSEPPLGRPPQPGMLRFGRDWELIPRHAGALFLLIRYSPAREKPGWLFPPPPALWEGFLFFFSFFPLIRTARSELGDFQPFVHFSLFFLLSVLYATKTGFGFA